MVLAFIWICCKVFCALMSCRKSQNTKYLCIIFKTCRHTSFWRLRAQTPISAPPLTPPSRTPNLPTPEKYCRCLYMRLKINQDKTKIMEVTTFALHNAHSCVGELLRRWSRKCLHVQDVILKSTPSDFFAFFSATVWDFSAKFCALI